MSLDAHGNPIPQQQQPQPQQLQPQPLKPAVPGTQPQQQAQQQPVQVQPVQYVMVLDANGRPVDSFNMKCAKAGGAGFIVLLLTELSWFGLRRWFG
jgi:hypothetical protein